MLSESLGGKRAASGGGPQMKYGSFIIAAPAWMPLPSHIALNFCKQDSMKKDSTV